MVTTEYADGRFGRYRLRMAAGGCPTPFLELCCGRTGSAAGRAWEPVPSSPFAEVARFEYEGGQYYHKRYLERGWLETVKAWAFGSRAERAWRGGHLLEENAFATPQMLVAGWRGAGCFTVTRAVTEGAKLGQYVQGLGIQADPRAQRALRTVAEELGRVVGRMHARGIVHGDLRWGNILVVEEKPGCPKFVFLDNERTRRYGRTPGRKVLKNLVQLNFVPDGLLSRTQRMRFWRAYRAEHGTLRGEPKQWIRRVVARTAWRQVRRAGKNRDVQ